MPSTTGLDAIKKRSNAERTTVNDPAIADCSKTRSSCNSASSYNLGSLPSHTYNVYVLWHYCYTINLDNNTNIYKLKLYQIPIQENGEYI